MKDEIRGDEFVIESRYNNVLFASKRISKFCRNYNIPRKYCDELEISLIEALNNVIEHSYDGSPQKEIKIEIKIDNSIISIKIIDAGLARKKLDKPELDYDPADIKNLPERGMGLNIIQNLMSETHYESLAGKNILTLIKHY